MDQDSSGLRSRVAALRQAARLPQADREMLLDAALTELQAAVDSLGDSEGIDAGEPAGGQAARHSSERRLLHAIFTATPTPLLVVDQEATVLRANAAASDLLDAGPGYATGKSLTALVEPAARAALRSKLASVARTGAATRLRCQLVASGGTVAGDLVVRPVQVRGDADRMLVAVFSEGNARSTARPPYDGPALADAALADAARRLDLLASTARMLLESATVSESVLLQRTARLICGALATWAIVDVRRRGQLRRHYVAGPDDPESASLVQAAVSAEPGPGSVPGQVGESGKPLLLAHLDDDAALGTTADGRPLAPLLDAGCLVSVPMADSSAQHGVLTLVRRARDGQLGLADAALAEEIGALLGRAISTRRAIRQRTDAADELRASLLPRTLKPIPGVEIASAHLAPTRGREVGGDFFDVYPTPGGWGVAIGDVCGTGEDAAAATAAARHAIRVLAHSDADPAQVLRGANEIMLAEEFGGRFVTACAAHLSWSDGALLLVLASAGHPGPVLVRHDGRAELVPGGGVALGIFPDPEPATRQLRLSEGDLLFFYTDGLTDARSPQAAYLEDSLADGLAQRAGHRPADVVADMRTTVLDFCDGVLLDELTMLALRVGRRPAG